MGQTTRAVENARMDNPNLFDFATSELSQDAFFAWLIAWADKAYVGSQMHDCGRAFLETVLLGGTGRELGGECQVKVQRQHKGIDIFCRVGDDLALVIEDKVGTQEHSGQLERYKKAVIAEGYAQDKIVCIYLKTLDQSYFSSVENAGYQIVGRDKLLAFFRLPQTREAMCENAILSDFVANLEKIEESVESYRTQPLDCWGWNSWIGFYAALQKHIKGRWDYVPPPGKFLGFWWKSEKVKHGEVFLLLEQKRACFKVTVYDSEKTEELKWHWNKAFKEAGKALGIDVINPSRLRRGEYMTVAILPGDSRVAGPDGILDMEATIARLRTMEQVLAYAITLEKDDKKEGATP